MKSTSVKGLPANKKGFSKYSGNVKSSGSALPKGERKSPAGGKTKSNLAKKVVIKKPGSVYK
jgi:hypothetical protein